MIERDRSIEREMRAEREQQANESKLLRNSPYVVRIAPTRAAETSRYSHTKLSQIDFYHSFSFLLPLSYPFIHSASWNMNEGQQLKYSIGPTERNPYQAYCGTPEAGLFTYASGLAFDQDRGHLFVVDGEHERVHVFDADDGSFVSVFGRKGYGAGQFDMPFDVAVDHEHRRIVVSDPNNKRLHLASAIDYSFLSEFVPDGYVPTGIAIDRQRGHLVVVSTTGTAHILSLLDGTLLHTSTGSQQKHQRPAKVAIDHRLGRIVVVHGSNVRVLSSLDASVLFEFSFDATENVDLTGVCVDNHSRIIVADNLSDRLPAFTHDGHFLSSFRCEYGVLAVAFDEHRGLIAFSTDTRVHVIGANQWLADTFTWRVDRHRYAPSSIKQAVSTMTMIRSLVDERWAMSMIPNELLFEIFSFL